MNGALTLLFGKMEFFMGGDQIGDFLSAESEFPLVAVAAEFQKSPQILMSDPGVGLDKWEDLPKADRFTSEPARSTRSTTGCLSPTASRTRTSGHTISIPRLHPDKTSIQQGYVTAEPYEIEKQGKFSRTSSGFPTTATRHTSP